MPEPFSGSVLLGAGLAKLGLFAKGAAATGKAHALHTAASEGVSQGLQHGATHLTSAAAQKAGMKIGASSLNTAANAPTALQSTVALGGGGALALNVANRQGEWFGKTGEQRDRARREKAPQRKPGREKDPLCLEGRDRKGRLMTNTKKKP